MKKIKDRVIIGASSALLAAILGRLVNGLEYRHGLTDEQYNQTGSSLLLPKNMAKSNSLESKIIGSLVNNTMVSVSGTLISYLLSITGRDSAILKGAGFGAVEWVGIWGISARLGLKVNSKKPLTHILSFIDHVMFGANTAWLISRFGDDSLFPDTKVKPGQKLQLISDPPQPIFVKKDNRKHVYPRTVKQKDIHSLK